MVSTGGSEELVNNVVTAWPEKDLIKLSQPLGNIHPEAGRKVRKHMDHCSVVVRNWESQSRPRLEDRILMTARISEQSLSLTYTQVTCSDIRQWSLLSKSFATKFIQNLGEASYVQPNLGKTGCDQLFSYEEKILGGTTQATAALSWLHHPANDEWNERKNSCILVGRFEA